MLGFSAFLSANLPSRVFIQACQAIQPERPEEIRRFFEGAVCFPYDKELLLQAFVYFNIERYLPDCDRP
jgi:hypothetical protein